MGADVAPRLNELARRHGLGPRQRAQLAGAPAGLGANDVALARALAAQPVVLEYAAPLLRTGGILVDWRGRRRPQEERAARAASRELGLVPLEIVATVPFSGATDHHLHLYMKV